MSIEPQKTRPSAPLAPSLAGQYLTFSLAGETFGLGILSVREIIELPTVTPVPLTPPWVLGVINLRGSVVPVIDLAVKFGHRPTELTRRCCIVIVEVRLHTELSLMGILVEAVSQVVELDAQDISPPPAFGSATDLGYLVGIGRASPFTLLLDPERVLAADELLRVAPLGQHG